MTPAPAPERSGAHTTLQKLLSRFHFGVTLLAVALSGITILLAGITTLRGYADRNMELAAQVEMVVDLAVESDLITPTGTAHGLMPSRGEIYDG